VLIEMLIHIRAGYENDGYPTCPEDAPDRHDSPAWELTAVVEDAEAWHPERVASGPTVDEALALAANLGAPRIVGS
jgi:hypothetical protein